MPWPWRSVLILLLVGLSPIPASSDGPPRRLDRVLPPKNAREAEVDEPAGSRVLTPAPRRIARPSVDRPGLLEPTVMRHGLGRDVLTAFQPRAPDAVQTALADLLAGCGLTIEAYAGTASAAPPDGTVRITTGAAPDS
jgi:hypothetical protein